MMILSRHCVDSVALRRTFGGLALLTVLAGPSAVQATSITVNTNSMTVSATDGKCTFAEAVAAVNTRVKSGSVAGECPAGDGSGDTITLMSTTQTYSTNNELTIYRSVEIVGAGQTKSILKTGGLHGIAVQDTLHIQPSVYIHGLTIDNRRTDGLPVFGLYFDGSEGLPHLNLYKVTVKNCDQGLWAGGGYVAGASVFAQEVTLANNKGSGLLNVEGIVTLDSSIVSGNKDTGIRSIGSSGSVSTTLDSTTVDGNQGVNGGGIYADGEIGGFLTLNDSTVSNNIATGDGGGLYDRGHITVRRSTFSGNKAARGGGLFHQSSGECYFYNSTIASNTATTAGGGIYSLGGTFAAVVASIVAKNTAPTGPDCTGSSGSGDHVNVGGNNSLLGNSAGCPSLAGVFIVQDQDAKLGALASTGLTGRTKIHPLLKGSPAINKQSSGDSEDQRGFQRPEQITLASGALSNGTSWDLGAYEYNTVWPYYHLGVPASSGDPLDSTGTFLTYGANAVDDYVTFTVPINETGTFTITARVQKWNQGGTYQMQIADSLAGTYVNANTLDLYSSSSTTAQVTLGTVTFSTTGLKYLRFKVTAKNAASSGYKLYIAYIKTVK